MSKDFVTIAIVILCIAALVFLIYKTVNLSSSNISEPGQDSNYLYDDPNKGGTSDDDTATAGLGDTDNESATDKGQNFDDPEPSVDYIGKDEIAPEDEVPGAGSRIPTSLNDSGDYRVLAGTFRIKSNAENHARRLRRLGYADADIAIFNRGTYAGVVVSRFDDLSSAQDLVRELKNQHGVEAFVQVSKGAN